MACSSHRHAVRPDYVLRSVRLEIGQHDSTAGIAFNKADIALRDSFIIDTYFQHSLASSFIHTKFYLFKYGLGVPDSYTVFAVRDSSLFEVPHHRTTDNFQDEELISFINDCLAEEPSFQGDSLLSLTSLVAYLTDPGYDFNRILSSASDIELRDNERLPERIRNEIHSPQISADGTSVVFFARSMGVGDLLKVTMKYYHKCLQFDTEFLGNFGVKVGIL